MALSPAEKQHRYRSFEAGYAGKPYKEEWDMGRWAEGVWRRQAEAMARTRRSDTKRGAKHERGRAGSGSG